MIRELEFTFRVDICEVSYPHYIDRVYDTKADHLVVIIMDATCGYDLLDRNQGRQYVMLL